MTYYMPHDNVYTKLDVTKDRGIGVFCIREIPENTMVFEGENNSLVWVNVKDIEDLKSEIKTIYLKFGIRRGDYIGIISHLNNLPIGWYVNHDHVNPNLNYNYYGYFFYANRKILVGEELTANYDLYCENRKYDRF